jgi:hypothetical protein
VTFVTLRDRSIPCKIRVGPGLDAIGKGSFLSNHFLARHERKHRGHYMKGVSKNGVHKKARYVSIPGSLATGVFGIYGFLLEIFDRNNRRLNSCLVGKNRVNRKGIPVKPSVIVSLSSWMFILFILSGYVTEYLTPNWTNGGVLAFFIVSAAFFGLVRTVVRKVDNA